MDLHKKSQTNNSITLGWNAPTGPHSQAYTYWVQWAPGGHPQGKQDPQGHQANHTDRTNETCYEMQALEPGTLYKFSVWAESNNVASSAHSLLASTGKMGTLLPGGGLGRTWGQWEVSGLQIPSGHGVTIS